MGQDRSAWGRPIIALERLEPRQLLSFTISGRVFEDLNANGRRQPKEPFLPNVQVFLDLNGNGIVDTGEATAVSDKHGTYRFKKLTRGNYDIRVVPPTGWVGVTPASDQYAFTNLRHGVSRNFGLQLDPPSIQREPSDTTPPTATLNAPDLTTPGSQGYQFSVTYSDASGVDLSSLGSGNISVTMPGNVVTLATFLGTDLGGNGSPRAATYQITPPSGTWSASDDGVYTLSIASGQVRDVVGNVDAPQILGSFNVAIGIPVLSAPTLEGVSDTGTSSTDGITSLNNSSAASALQFQVSGAMAGATVTIYADGNAIGSAVANGGTTVVASNGQTVLAAGAHSITARQTLSNGLNSALSAASTIIVDDAAPSAALSAQPVTGSGGQLYSFSVTYADDTDVDLITLSNGNIVVTGPNGFSEAASLITVDQSNNSPSVTASYSLIPPGGSWNANANGTYTVSLQAGQVGDIAGNDMTAGALGTFSVSAFTPQSDQPGTPRLLPASDSGASQSDNVTYFNNSSSAPLGFLIPGTVSGATITLFADGTAIGSTVASGATTQLTTNGLITLGDGPHAIAATQTEPGLPQSSPSPADDIVIDTTPPTASSNPAGVSSVGGTLYSFTVSYSDNVAIDVTSLDSHDVVVTGPAGFAEQAVLASVSSSANGTPRTVTYQIVPPGGAWSVADNGTYTIHLQPGSVYDTAGNSTNGGTLATFNVNAIIAASPAPAAPQLADVSDTGALNNDGVTKLNNSSAASALQFIVGNTSAGATVTLFADGRQVGSTTATGANTTITTDGATMLPDGAHIFTARQTLAGSSVSAASAGTMVTIDTAAPTGSATFASIASAGGSGYDFSVVYSDNVAINAASLNSNDIVVTGPHGYSSAATLTSVDSRSGGSPRQASYHIPAPGGSWDSSDNGSYTVTLQSGQVLDTAGNAAAQATLGTITVNITGTASPAPGAPVLYSTSDSGSSSSDGVTSFNNSGRSTELVFSVPNVTVGAVVSIYADGTFLGSGVASGSTTLVATRGDTPLSDGPHHFTARQLVSGMLQSANSSVTLITVDTTPPTATVSAANVTTAGNTDYFFNVTYTDATAIDASTLHDANVLVMGPNGYSQAATFVTADNPANGSPRTVTYEIRPPNDEWTASDNGTYVLFLQSGQVADIAGNVAPAASLGTFNISVPTPAPVALYLTSAGGATSVSTSLNNSSSASRLQFTVTGTLSGATITLYADGHAIGSAQSTAGSTTLYTDGITALAPGPHQITATQTLPGAPESAASALLTLTVTA